MIFVISVCEREHIDQFMSVKPHTLAHGSFEIKKDCFSFSGVNINCLFRQRSAFFRMKTATWIFASLCAFVCTESSWAGECSLQGKRLKTLSICHIYLFIYIKKSSVSHHNVQTTKIWEHPLKFSYWFINVHKTYKWHHRLKWTHLFGYKFRFICFILERDVKLFTFYHFNNFKWRRRWCFFCFLFSWFSWFFVMCSSVGLHLNKKIINKMSCYKQDLKSHPSLIWLRIHLPPNDDLVWICVHIVRIHSEIPSNAPCSDVFAVYAAIWISVSIDRMQNF